MSNKGAQKNREKPKKQDPMTLIFKIDNAWTACELLSIPEDHVVLAALAVIDEYITLDEYENIKKLVHLNLLEKLTALLGNKNIIPEIFRFVLKTLLRITAYEEFLLIVLVEKNIIPCYILVDYFIDTTDLFFLEKYIVLLQRFSSCLEFKKRLCDPQIIAKIFTLMSKCSVVTVRHNCLKLLHVLIHCNFLIYHMEFIRAFHIETLHKLLREEELKPLVLNIFEKLSKWALPSVHLALYEADCINRFLELLMEHYKWSEANNQIVQILTNLIRNTSDQYLNVATQSFFKYFHFGRFTNSDHALACLALIDEFANCPSALNTLHDFGLTKHFSEFTDFECPLIQVKVCHCLAKLFKGCHYLEESIYKKYIIIFGDLLKQSNYPWVPYRQAPLLPLFQFLIKHPELAETIAKFHILPSLKVAFLNRNQLEKRFYKYLINIYHVLLLNESCQEELLSKEVYNLFYCKFKECLTDKKDLCTANSVFLKLLYLTFSLPEYRAMFLERKGHILICNALKTHCSKLSYLLISFLKAVTHFQDLALAFLRVGILDIINKLSDGEISRRIGILRHLGEDFIEKDVTVKFHLTNVLEPTHEILTTFVVSFGKAPEYFPLNEPPKVLKISFTDTLIVVHLGDPKIKFNPLRKPLISFDPYKQMIKDYCKLVKESEGLYCGDPFIPFFITTLTEKFSAEHNLDIRSKVAIIAQFIHQLLSKDGKIPSAQDCLAHRNELKIQLQTNFLPLGFFRCGSLFERAVLFKVLSDHLGIPCRLLRNKNRVNFLWNEVIMECSQNGLLQQNGADKSRIKDEFSPLIKSVANWNTFWKELGDDYEKKTTKYPEEEEIFPHLFSLDDEYFVFASDIMFTSSGQDLAEGPDHEMEIEHYANPHLSRISSLKEESYNEISETKSSCPVVFKFCLQEFVVDLKNEIGALYTIESKEAQQYLDSRNPHDKN